MLTTLLKKGRGNGLTKHDLAVGPRDRCASIYSSHRSKDVQQRTVGHVEVPVETFVSNVTWNVGGWQLTC